MTVEQFVVGSILVIILTAWVVWQFLFLPRLDELDKQRRDWKDRAEAAEHEIRNQEKDTIKIVGEFGDPMDILEGDINDG